MLERIISAEELNEKPWKIVFLGFLYASFSLIIAYLIFPGQADISMIFLATILCMPLLHKFILNEQNVCVDAPLKRRLNIFQTIKEQLHPKLILLFGIMFLVFILTFTFWYIFLPQDMSNALFGIQKRTIISINQEVESSLSRVTGMATAEEVFNIILLNNIKVLLFSVLLSFLFGAGAIFILTWNSSVISVAIGELLIKNLYTYGTGTVAATKAFSRYLIHGIPELAAYLIAIFSGVFVSIGVIRFPVRSREFVRLLITSLNLVIFSLIILIFSAVLEVYISPLIV